MGFQLNSGVVLSGASSASRSSADQETVDARGALIVVDFTATPNNVETFTLAVEARDLLNASGKYAPITAFTPLTASTLGAAPTAETYLYTVYPAAVETTALTKHEVMGLVLPRLYRVRGVHSAAGSWTYTVTLHELP